MKLSLVLISSALAIIASARVELFDLPKADTTKYWVAGTEVVVPFCWMGLKGGRNPYSDGLKMTVKKGLFGKKHRLETSFVEMKNIAADSHVKVAKFKMFMRDSWNKISKCWIAKFTLPSDLKSGSDYHVRLERKFIIGNRHYDKSSSVSIISVADNESLNSVPNWKESQEENMKTAYDETARNTHSFLSGVNDKLHQGGRNFKNAARNAWHKMTRGGHKAKEDVKDAGEHVKAEFVTNPQVQGVRGKFNEGEEHLARKMLHEKEKFDQHEAEVMDPNSYQAFWDQPEPVYNDNAAIERSYRDAVAYEDQYANSLAGLV